MLCILALPFQDIERGILADSEIKGHSAVISPLAGDLKDLRCAPSWCCQPV